MILSITRLVWDSKRFWKIQGKSKIFCKSPEDSTDPKEHKDFKRSQDSKDNAKLERFQRDPKDSGQKWARFRRVIYPSISKDIIILVFNNFLEF